jgi:hypothetical protein
MNTAAMRAVTRGIGALVAIIGCACVGSAGATDARLKDRGPATALTQPIFSDWGYVTRFATAWNDDALAVYHQPLGSSSETVVQQIIGCPVSNDGYATDPGQPGRKLQHAAIIGAYLHHKQVQLLIKGCAYGKPRIISVGVRD